MQGWQRSQFFADTGLTWTPPSPNLRTPSAAILYPAIGLTEQTNISVGRGTPDPFENLGAPFVDAPQLAAYLTARNIPGVAFAPSTLTVAETPERYPSHGQTVPAIHFTVTDRSTLDTPELGIEILAALHTLYPKQFSLGKAAHLVANPQTMQALERGEDPRAIASAWTPGLQAFRTRRQPFLLYQ